MVVQEGLAHLCLVGANQTIVKARIEARRGLGTADALKLFSQNRVLRHKETSRSTSRRSPAPDHAQVSMPRKHGPAVAGFEKTLHKFFEQILQGILRHVDFGVVRCVVLAGPGFTKDQLLEYIMQEAQRKEIRAPLEARQKFITAHASSG